MSASSPVWSWLVPGDTLGRRLTILAIVAAVGIYLWRTYIDFVAWYTNFCILGSILASLGVILYYAWRMRPYRGPLLLFFLGTVLAFAAPPLPSREQLALIAHRADYEHAVEMARQHQLPSVPSCAYSLPPQYRELSVSCLTVYETPVLVVEFTPIAGGKRLIYMDDVSGLSSLPQCHRGNMLFFTQLDAHWYLCLGDANTSGGIPVAHGSKPESEAVGLTDSLGG